MPPGVTQPGRLTPNNNKGALPPGRRYMPGKAWGSTNSKRAADQRNANATKAARAKIKDTKTNTGPGTKTPDTSTTGNTPNYTPVDTPGAAALTPEDQALKGNYDPTQLTDPLAYGKVGGGGQDLASKFDAASYAKGMAGMQYDPAVTQLATRIKGIINALPGSLDSLNKAFSNLDARAANPPQVSVVGGNTTEAANNYQSAMAANTNTATASQALANDSRKADWEQRIRLLSGANVNDLRGQLAGVTQQRADAQTGYYQQGIKTKSDLVSQAISNINSMRASNAAMALTGANLEGAGLKNAAQLFSNEAAQSALLYQPYQEAQGLKEGAQTIASNNISIAQAKANLKDAVGDKKTLAAAVSAGGPGAIQSLQSLIIPSGGITQDGSYQHVHGDPNQWVKSGVGQIMRTLPNSKRANVVKFVNEQVKQALGPAGGWKQNKNGQWVRPK